MFWKIGLLVILTSFLFLNCQGKVDEEMSDTAAEEAILKDLIRQQDEVFLNRNIEGEKMVWANEPYVIRITGNYITDVGWDSITAFYKRNFSTRSEYAEGERPRNSFSNHIIKFFGDLAWMVCDIQTEQKYEGIDYNYNQKNIRIYEKKNGQWKVVFGHMGRVMYPEPQQTEVDLQRVGNRLLNSDQVERAIEIYKLNVKLFPESSEANENLANAYLRQGNKELAKKHCEKALELNPLNRSAKALMEKI